MKKNRRNFLKLTGLAGLSVAGGGILKGMCTGSGDLSKSNNDNLTEQAKKQRTQKFNMCGYAAPKIETVRIGFIGLGSRGPGHVSNMSLLEGVEIKALCDIVPDEAEKVKKED